jgi:hypothetical protein
MAKQFGLVKLLGNVGDVTFYRSRDGYLVKQKTSLTADRIASDPKFERTRENMAEFGNAGKAGKTLRQSINLPLQYCKDGRLVARLCKTMMQVVKSDTVNARGQRKVSAGDISILEHFEFNVNAAVNTIFNVPYTTAIDRATGALSVTVPAFAPATTILAPAGATHFKLLSAGAAIDFDGEKFVSANTSSIVLPLNQVFTAAITLANTVTAGSNLPLFLVLGIQFFQEVNGNQYPLNDTSFNALSIVAIDKP